MRSPYSHHPAAQPPARVCLRDCSGCRKTSRAPRRRLIRYNSARATSELRAVCVGLHAREVFLSPALFLFSHSFPIPPSFPISCIIRCIGLVTLSLSLSLIRRRYCVSSAHPGCLIYVYVLCVSSLHASSDRRLFQRQPPNPTIAHDAAAVRSLQRPKPPTSPPCLTSSLHSVFSSILV